MQCKTTESDFVGDPGDCEVCGRPLRDEGFFCDAQMPAHGGRWGVLCKTCTVSEGIRPDWGRAQYYVREATGLSGATAQSGLAELKWRCMAGKPPTDTS